MDKSIESVGKLFDAVIMDVVAYGFHAIGAVDVTITPGNFGIGLSLRHAGHT